LAVSEHLDWLSANDEKSSQDPVSEKKDSFVLTQTQIDLLHDTYRQSFEDNPCEPDIAKQAFLAWLQGREVIGEGKQFPNLEVFMEWLTLQAKVGEIFPITKGWSSDFELSITPLVSCFACTPPKLTGTLDLTVDLKTCQVTGKISAEGEGDVTINDCVDKKPFDDTCTSHGKVNISGDITGTATKDGQLTLNPTKAKFTYATQWIPHSGLMGVSGTHRKSKTAPGKTQSPSPVHWNGKGPPQAWYTGLRQSVQWIVIGRGTKNKNDLNLGAVHHAHAFQAQGWQLKSTPYIKM